MKKIKYWIPIIGIYYFIMLDHPPKRLYKSIVLEFVILPIYYTICVILLCELLLKN